MVILCYAVAMVSGKLQDGLKNLGEVTQFQIDPKKVEGNDKVGGSHGIFSVWLFA